MSSDAIVVLKQDHKQMRELFRQFARAKDVEQRARVIEQVVEALTAHTYIENECMYPRVRELVHDTTDDILESYEEHHVADVLSAELAAMKPEDKRYYAKATVLIENLTHHMEEEEQDWFRTVRNGLSRKQLKELGQQLLELKESARRQPMQPHTLTGRKRLGQRIA